MKIIVFDLDDTLYKEIDCLKSAYKEIADFLYNEFEVQAAYEFMIQKYYQNENVFVELNNHFSLSIPIETYLKIYRNHSPNICLDEGTLDVLNALRKQEIKIGLITDGRTLSQGNKIKALGLENYIDKNLIIISEEFGFAKPNISNYIYFQNIFPNVKYIYIGDNINKDFISPNSLGWETICLLDNGLNIHKQNFDLNKEYLPKYNVSSLKEILDLI
ncbi:MAG: HAD family hydrolase [Paludibacter sp.]